MVKHEVIVLVEKPIEEVFKNVVTDYFMNFMDHTRWYPGVLEVEQISGGPIAVGTTGKLRRQGDGKVVYMFEISDYQVNKLLAIEVKSRLAKFNANYVFQPVDKSTRLTITYGLRMGVPHIWVEGFMANSFKNELEKTGMNIKELVEKGR